MNAPAFLNCEQVERLHQKALARFGGLDGLRDRAVFESAVIQPQNTYYYGSGDLFEMAAAYAYHLAESQAFLDGNKRTAMAAALTFLTANGVQATWNDQALYEAMIAVAEKQMTKAQLADVFRTLSQG